MAAQALGALACGVVFLVRTLYYNASVPLWELHNESGAINQHIRDIAMQRSLPVADSQIQLTPTG